MKLLFKLAKDNLKRNKEIYIPYILTVVLSVVFFYLTLNLYFNKSINLDYGYNTLKILLYITAVAIAVMSLIFNIYINSFLNKRRSVDYGVYDLLGMDKRHIKKLIFIENIILNIVSITIGIFSSIILDRLNFLIISRALNFESTLKSALSLKAVIITIIVFFLITFTSIILTSYKVIRQNGLDILNVKKKVQRKSVLSVLMAIVGIIFIVIGYIIAVILEPSNLMAVEYAFLDGVNLVYIALVAVIFVIIGTYLIFQGLIVSIFNYFKKRRNIYKKNNNFIAISNLSIRIKENAVSLATICILSCMIIVTLCMSIIAYVGSVYNVEPYDIVYGSFNETDSSNIDSAFRKDLKNNKLEIEDFKKFEVMEGIATYPGLDNKDIIDIYKSEGQSYISAIKMSDYNKLADEKIELREDEVVLLANNLFDYEAIINTIKENINIFGKDFKLKEESLAEDENLEYYFYNLTLVIPDDYFDYIKEEFVYDQLEDGRFKNKEGEIVNDAPIQNYFIEQSYNLSGDKAEKKAFFEDYFSENSKINSVSEVASEGFLININSIYLGDQVGMGPFVVVGVYLTIIFLINFLIVVYYKQLSEGYEDAEQFKKLYKVGLTKDEINTTINKQITIFFFLPLLVATVHYIFVINIIKLFALSFGIISSNKIQMIVLITLLLYIIIYFIAYLITSRKYRNIIINRSEKIVS